MTLSQLLAELRDSSNPRWRRPRHPFFRVMAWIAVGMTLLSLLAMAGVAILLNNARFHDYLVRTAEQQASETLGVRVQLQNYAVNFSNLSMDLYGVTVDGASPYSNPPLLQVDHAQAGVRITSILTRTWYLTSFELDHPVVHVFVDSKGVSNIPTIKSSGQSGNTSFFDLGVRHAVLTHGEFYYNDEPAKVAADLHDLEVKASFNSLLKKYSGKVAYSNGELVYGTLHPMAHSLEVEFAATSTQFELTQAKLTTGRSVVRFAGALDNYNNPEVQGHYDIVLDGKQVGEILKEPTVPSGMVHTAGTVSFKQVPGRAEFDALTVAGTVDSRGLDIHTRSINTQISDIAAHYGLANGDAELHDLHARLLGGMLTAQGSIKQLSGNPHSEMTAEVRGVSLADAVRALGPAAQPKPPLRDY